MEQEVAAKLENCRLLALEEHNYLTLVGAFDCLKIQIFLIDWLTREKSAYIFFLLVISNDFHILHEVLEQ